MNVRSFSIGFLTGILLLGIVGWLTMPRLMLTEHASPYGVEETVAKIAENARAEGWVVSGVTALDESVRKHGGGELPPVRLINLCQAQHAFNILEPDETKIVSVMMPCTISVYRKQDGRAYIGTMNAALLGRMFGGTVAEVMGDQVASQQAKFISFAE